MIQGWSQEMHHPLPRDVVARLNQNFGGRADVLAAFFLDHRRIGSDDVIDDRLLRCIVFAARGDEHQVQQLIDLARQDIRDVIIAGEYDGAMRRIRDLSVSFLIDCPEKFWIS